MIELDFKLKSEQARKRFEGMARKITDLRPIWKQFIPKYSELVETEFDSTKGKIMQGKKWMKLNDAYRKQKRVKYGNKPLLVATGRLREAAIKFKTKSKKQSLKMSIDGIKYASAVQNKRAYFHTPDGGLPMRAWRILIDIADRELQNG